MSNHHGKKRKSNHEFHPPAKRQRVDMNSRVEMNSRPECGPCVQFTGPRIVSAINEGSSSYTIENHTIVGPPNIFSRLGPSRPPDQTNSTYHNFGERNVQFQQHYSPGNTYSDHHPHLNPQQPPVKRRRLSRPKGRKGPRINNIVLPLSDEQCLHELANSETGKAVALLSKHGRERELQDILRSKDATSGSITLTLLVKMFAKLGTELLTLGTSHQPSTHFMDRKLKEIMRYLIDNHTFGGFYLSLGNFLCQIPTEGNISKRRDLLPILHDTIAMCNVLLDIYPGQASGNLPIIDTCVGTATQLGQQQILFQEVSEKAQQLLRKRNDIRTKSYELNCESHCGQELFSVVLPRSEELHQDISPTLRKNVISGAFPDASCYFTIQFQLLREDFLNPLRKALRGVCEVEDDESQNVMVYQDVRFDKGKTFTFSGITYRISFKTPHKIKWNRSKKLQYGSLVCLSTDNFQTVLYATIVERDAEDLNKGITSIQLQDCSPDDEMRLSQITQFSMIESPGYYEAYAPVLKRLHMYTTKPTELPFKSYLVDLNTEVAPPNYLKDVQPILDLKGIVCKCSASECEHENVDILDEEKWDALQTPSLDPSQKKALHMALTREMTLIQGPPGTGKTYVGLRLIETLIRNENLWKYTGFALAKCPIVVICYTNHALDQFLEGILRLKLNIQVRRIGSRTKSEAIRELNLQKFVHKHCREHRIFNPMKSWIEKQKIVEAMDEFINGQFCQEKSQLYCYFLSRYVIDDIEDSCKLTLPCPTISSGYICEYGQFASWLDAALQTKIAHFYEDQKLEDHDYLFKADNDARREMSNSYSNIPEVHDIFQALRHKGIENFIQRFGKVEPLTERRADVLLKGHDEINSHVKLQLFKYCLKQLYLHHSAELKCRIKDQEKYDKNMQLIKLRCLQKADVIGLTTTAAARDNALISQVQSKILIVEEAAEVLEPQLVAALTKHTQHVILIGDHKQLRPKTIDHIIGREYQLDISMFERLVKNNFPHATLTVQHRMRPEISQIVSKHIYDGILHDHEDTLKYDNIEGMKHNMFFVDHCQPEDPNPDLKSPSNKHEAAFLTGLCNYLLQQGYQPHQITVITPYVGQMFELRSQFREKGISNVSVTPIDSYQGEENDIILLSLVRSKRPGFVKDENRICVALSRAKKGLYCIGNFTLFSKCKLWAEILKDVHSRQLLSDSLPLQCVRHSKVTSVSCAADFDSIADGGCQEICHKRLPCNHVCQRRCHPSDEIHKSPCKEKCPKRCAAGLHRCKRLCFEMCGVCEEPVERVIEKCGHEQSVPCYIRLKDFICQEDCTKILKCGHICKNRCGEECITECMILVEKVLSCGHTQKVECHLDPEKAAKRCNRPCEEILACEHKCSGTCGKCHQGRLHVPCRENCTRILLCGHPCSGACGKNCPPCRKKCIYSCQHGPCGHQCSSPCLPCPHECNWNCDHFQCSRNCGEICDRDGCKEKCPKLLKCGHPCIGVCGEPCPDVCRQCLSQDDFEAKIPLLFGNEHDEDAKFVVLEDCGHILEVEALDRWMDQVDEEIKWKCCPLCKAHVMKTARYSNVTKGILQDMNEIKKQKQHFLSVDDRKEMRETLSTISLTRLQHGNFIPRRTSIHWSELVRGFSDFVLQKAYTTLLSAYNVLKAIENLKDLLDQLPSRLSSKPLNVLLSQAEDFLDWIKRYKHRDILTDQMTIDINAERRRILLLETSLKAQLTFVKCKTKIDEDDKELFTEISSYETNGNKIQKLTDNSVYERIIKRLQSMPNKYRVPLTIDERNMIIKAIGAKPGSWYKCPKGHYYQIGDCGGAMVTSKCPECGLQIGGHNHQLLATNQHAREFDSSVHPAWSEGANMQNFDLGNLL